MELLSASSAKTAREEEAEDKEALAVALSGPVGQPTSYGPILGGS